MRKKKLFAALGSVRMVKNDDRGRENAALGLRPRSQFFTTRTSQPANNTYIQNDNQWGTPYHLVMLQLESWGDRGAVGLALVM